jgi:NhaP-type Na+/H+ or K+/H+ antiporter
VIIAGGEATIGPTLAIILAAGMVAQWLAWRARVPSIIVLLLAGLVLGPVTGVLDPDELLGGALFPLVSIAVAVILFEGGLDLAPRTLRNTGTVVRRLISVGAVVTFFVGWLGARQLFEIPDAAAMVLGAVLVVTGPTVIGPLLQFVRPTGTTGPILRAEGVLIDPIGATAALVAFEIAATDQTDEAVVRLVGLVALTIIAGAGLGLAAALLLDRALRRFLVPDHLVIPVTFAFVIAAFVAANRVQDEAGLLAVTMMGMYLARRDSSTIRHVVEFNESLRTLLISVLFILLAARIDPDALRDVFLPSLVFIALLVLVGRPLAVLASSVRTRLTWPERLFLMTMAPRGIVAAAVSAIFALRLEEEGVSGADQIVPIVFLVIIGTIVVYGFLAGPVARKLGLAEGHAAGVLIAGAHASARALGAELARRGLTTLLVDTDPYNVARATMAGLPARQMSVLSDEAVHELDLRGIGRLLAVTSNDEVNVLAAARFARVFGRGEVFQLSPTTRRGQKDSMPEELLGRQLGLGGLTFAQLDERYGQGWRITGADDTGAIAEAVELDQFVPLAHFDGGRVSFLCRDDPLPSGGEVLGLCAPGVPARLVADPVG